MGKREDRREYYCVGWDVDYVNDFNRPGVTTRTKAVIRLGQITYTTTYRAAIARQSAWQRTPQQRFRECGCHPLCRHFKKRRRRFHCSILRVGILEALVLEMQNTSR